LQPGTNFLFRVKAVNEHGEYAGHNRSFTTMGAKPGVFASHAEAGETTATLFGTVNPNMLNTMVWFEWGTFGNFQHSVQATEYPIYGESHLQLSVEIGNLLADTDYLFRIKAENELGTTYSNEKAFRTYSGSVTDVEGNVYPTIIIGSQEWMAKNLKTTQYNNGISIFYPGSDNDAWVSNTAGAYGWYNNETTWKDSYGALYNWYAVNNSNGLCPTGWHVPSHDQWTQLEQHICNQLGNANCETQFPYDNTTWGDCGTNEGNALKSCRQVNSPLGGDCSTEEHPRWEEGNETHYGFDEFGFSALPGGVRLINGSFNNVGYYGAWWSSSDYSTTNGWSRYLINAYGNVYRAYGDKVWGFSVRCVREIN